MVQVRSMMDFDCYRTYIIPYQSPADASDGYVRVVCSIGSHNPLSNYNLMILQCYLPLTSHIYIYIYIDIYIYIALYIYTLNIYVLFKISGNW